MNNCPSGVIPPGGESGAGKSAFTYGRGNVPVTGAARKTAARRRFLAKLLAVALLTVVLGGCGPEESRPAAYPADNGAQRVIVVNDLRHDALSTLQIHPLPMRSATDKPPVFHGTVAGILPHSRDTDKFYLFFTDGAVSVYSLTRPEELVPLAPAQATGYYFTVTRAAEGFWAMRQDAAGRVEICRRAEITAQTAPAPATPALENLTVNDWRSAGLPLPFDEFARSPQLASWNGHLLLAWRRSNGRLPLAGLQMAVWDTTDRRNPAWRFLPSPPHNLLTHAFALCEHSQGDIHTLVLAQENPANRSLELAHLLPAPQKDGPAALLDGTWRSLALSQFPAETLAQAAVSLKISAGRHGLLLARADMQGVQMLSAPRFPDDPGAVIPSPRPAAKEPAFSLMRVLWWIIIGMLVCSLLFRRKIPLRATRADRAKMPEEFAAAYREMLRDYANRKIGGLGSVFDRGLAMAVDGTVCLIMPAAYLVYYGENDWLAAAFSYKLFFLWMGALVVYGTLAESFFGCTPGKALRRLRVRHAEGGRAGFWQILVRNLLRVLDFFPLALGGVNFWGLIAIVCAYLTRNRQRLGDLLGRTVVRYHYPLSKRNLVLASASPQRQVLLKTLGLKFSVHPSTAEERGEPHLSPPEMALSIAEAKAEAVSARSPQRAIIIAADTMVVVDTEILGKPQDDADARRMLKMLSGRKHLVITAVALIDNATGQHVADCEITELTWKELSDREIDEYIQSGEHRGRAGAYGIQGRAAAFAQKIDGSMTNIIGLPLELLADMLEDLDG